MQKISNVRVRESVRLIAPRALKDALPATPEALATTLRGRNEVESILEGTDKRLLVVVGPCSIHDPEGAWEYAQKLMAVRDKVSDVFCIIMRTYFEKPRTTIGWKGLINDPHLDDTFDIADGLAISRRLLLQITAAGLPVATEFLDPITPQYIDDLVSWAAIGARTTESQTHREMASGLSMPVGFKNGTDGGLQVAIDAMNSARHSHHFLGIDKDGQTSIIVTTGNPLGHIVLRGGRARTNFDPESIAEATASLKKAGLPPATIMVDCSHANSSKKPERQEIVWQSILAQRAVGIASGNECAIIGAMIESYLKEGAQPVAPRSQLQHGVSITDPCISWETTESLLLRGAEEVRAAAKSAVPATA
ncbi:3-deoxy-7-phosphoheptulonate synthase [Verrucomicrobia bacterium LW23]|nr:3-deoxy-7-phosphoheptulonate synthase [Verrucomicrobia bacterium LW23]